MTFDELRALVSAVDDDERQAHVRFGCDCGCGGSSFTAESWDRMCEAADTAREKLRAIGITFWDEEPRHAD